MNHRLPPQSISIFELEELLLFDIIKAFETFVILSFLKNLLKHKK